MGKGETSFPKYFQDPEEIRGILGEFPIPLVFGRKRVPWEFTTKVVHNQALAHSENLLRLFMVLLILYIICKLIHPII